MLRNLYGCSELATHFIRSPDDHLIGYRATWREITSISKYSHFKAVFFPVAKVMHATVLKLERHKRSHVYVYVRFISCFLLPTPRLFLYACAVSVLFCVRLWNEGNLNNQSRSRYSFSKRSAFQRQKNTPVGEKQYETVFSETFHWRPS